MMKGGETVLLYHGNNREVREPRLLKSQRDLDFGKGFYTTSDLGQAQSWAMRTARIRKAGRPCVTCYEIDAEALQGLSVLRFDQLDSAWLDYVAAKRQDSHQADQWDLVVGPVANDQTFPTLLLYLDGYVDAETTIKNLLPQKLKDQYTFKTQRAIGLLECKEVLHP